MEPLNRNKVKKLFCTLLIVGLALTLGAKPTIRILCIGNSFSVDAVEQYLYEIADADSINLVIGNLYIGGCSLERHALNVRTDSADYLYIKNVGGVLTKTPQTRLSTAFADEDWDIVTMQQASHYSGFFETYEPYLQELMDSVALHVRPDTRWLWQMTWSYSLDATHPAYPYYGRDQMKMYEAILRTNRWLHRHYPRFTIIPTGTAIQNARATLGDIMNRDGYHLHYQHGRYTAACTWYEIITRRSVVGNSFRPEWAEESLIHSCQQAAHQAVRKPWKVSR